MMFDKFVNEEWSEYKIVKFLHENHVLTTDSYIGSKQGDYRNPYKWTMETVRRLLSMQEYAEDTVNFKSHTISFKTKQCVRIPKSEWLVFKDTHPPIVTREMFDKAQEQLNRKRELFFERTHEYDTYFGRKCHCSEYGTKFIINVPIGLEEIVFNCKNFVLYKTCNSHNVREMTLRNIFREQMTILKKALIETPDEIERKLGISGLSEMQDEKTKLQNKVNQLAEAISLDKKNYGAIRETIDYINECDFSVITEEICDVLIEKAVVGEFLKCGKSNYGRQPIYFYINNIGMIGSLVNVCYKTYTERITEIIPQLWKGRKVYIGDICEELGTTYAMLKKGFQHEETTYLDIIVATKIRTIENSRSRVYVDR